MARQGWILEDISFSVFEFRVQYAFHKKEESYEITYRVVELEHHEEVKLWQKEGWHLLGDNNDLAVFATMKKDIVTPNVKMRSYSKERLLNSLCNIVFIITLIMSFREYEMEKRLPMQFAICYFFMALPTVFFDRDNRYKTKSTQIINALIFSVGATLILEVINLLLRQLFKI